MQFPLIIVFGSVIIIWLAALTFYFFRVFTNYKNLVKDVNGGNLETVLKRILDKQELNGRDISDINKKVNVLQKEGLGHIQKIGFVRFNPFNETGGDSSFTLCLMDANLDGIILTGLHTREKTRVYAKRIEKARSKYELSQEEQHALKEALK